MYVCQCLVNEAVGRTCMDAQETAFFQELSKGVKDKTKAVPVIQSNKEEDIFYAKLETLRTPTSWDNAGYP